LKLTKIKPAVVAPAPAVVAPAPAVVAPAPAVVAPAVVVSTQPNEKKTDVNKILKMFTTKDMHI
jgi:hypothetical protein